MILTCTKPLLLHACIHLSIYKHAHVYMHAHGMYIYSAGNSLFSPSICVFRRVLQRSREYSEVNRYQVLYYLESFGTFCLCY